MSHKNSYCMFPSRRSETYGIVFVLRVSLLSSIKESNTSGVNLPGSFTSTSRSNTILFCISYVYEQVRRCLQLPSINAFDSSETFSTRSTCITFPSPRESYQPIFFGNFFPNRDFPTFISDKSPLPSSLSSR